MENNYRILGLENNASTERVQEAYRKLSVQYNPDNFTDPAQKKWAKEQMERINKAFDEIMNFNRAGAVSTGNTSDDGKEFYIYIRRLIQHGEYENALVELKKYPNENDSEWQFLMGSALYYSGFASKSYEHFQRAANMEPNNREYTATYNRMSRNRNGNIYGSPYSQQQTYSGGMVCCDPCTVCQCLMCMDCLCH